MGRCYMPLLGIHPFFDVPPTLKSGWERRGVWLLRGVKCRCILYDLPPNAGYEC